jgi:hypothetical protein
MIIIIVVAVGVVLMAALLLYIKCVKQRRLKAELSNYE